MQLESQLSTNEQVWEASKPAFETAPQISD